jgi:hypothetical protein
MRKKTMQLWQFSKLLVILILFVVLTTGQCWAGQKKVPFHPGEKLIFELKWSFLPVGEATLEILPIRTINATRAYHFRLTAKTYPFIDLFYKVRDQIDAFTDTEMTHSVYYKKVQVEGGTHRDIVIDFDWHNKVARYSNFEKERREIPLPNGTFDPLSAFYYVRTQDLAVGKVLKRPITDGKKSVIGKMRIVKRERIVIAKQKYDTFLIEPELKHVGGVFEKSKNAKIQVWVTADKWKIPVKLQSKVVVGSFTGTLRSAAGVKME